MLVLLLAMFTSWIAFDSIHLASSNIYGSTLYVWHDGLKCLLFTWKRNQYQIINFWMWENIALKQTIKSITATLLTLITDCAFKSITLLKEPMTAIPFTRSCGHELLQNVTMHALNLGGKHITKFPCKLILQSCFELWNTNFVHVLVFQDCPYWIKMKSDGSWEVREKKINNHVTVQFLDNI